MLPYPGVVASHCQILSQTLTGLENHGQAADRRSVTNPRRSWTAASSSDLRKKSIQLRRHDSSQIVEPQGGNESPTCALPRRYIESGGKSALR